MSPEKNLGCGSAVSRCLMPTSVELLDRNRGLDTVAKFDLAVAVDVAGLVGVGIPALIGLAGHPLAWVSFGCMATARWLFARNIVDRWIGEE